MPPRTRRANPGERASKTGGAGGPDLADWPLCSPLCACLRSSNTQSHAKACLRNAGPRKQKSRRKQLPKVRDSIASAYSSTDLPANGRVTLCLVIRRRGYSARSESCDSLLGQRHNTRNQGRSKKSPGCQTKTEKSAFSGSRRKRWRMASRFPALATHSTQAVPRQLSMARIMQARALPASATGRAAGLILTHAARHFANHSGISEFP